MPSHDAIFKQFLSDTEIARDFLSIHLPPEIRQHCDFTTLQRESASFVDEELRSRVSDMLYSCRTSAGRGYIYCVIEHQSSPDRLMAFRLLRYSLAAMQQHLSQGHKTLPLVVPLLFYHGDRRPYPYSLNWLDGFTDQVLARQIYTTAFPLLDLTVTPDEEIKTHRRAALLELVLKHIRTRDMLELARDIGMLMEMWTLPLTQQRALMFYIAHMGRTSDYRAFIDGVTEPLTGAREENMETIANQLKREGFEKGLQQGKEKWLAEGLEQGLEQGMRASALRIARQMLKNGMPPQQVQQMTDLSDDDMQTAMSVADE
ncbi:MULTISPECIES: Rpn family recombination-promoting nuclease/putative transposase [unclassified Brenneria]|uniref:Rpn family recombination-promoting nuclease/putative transposase n=1 Tax=unclassified Brenneria TaxID=2634434 RepID=UPI0029C46E06|nr:MULTISPECIES: Rpn family recombination-promoting nuclease/putative transposase [unclassified Brenneria]MDX5626441.1 Rpn family recombination-promoting nuclease/putative transposase [Brenneria sp. L3-3Z]MDX5694209.1 Rpn family recombination-promoting nuclease/putative transposase [Brenneria sp. L4-2C]